MRYVIVGAGPAGLSAAEAILELDPAARPVVVSEEDRPPYCRPLISYWLSGETPADLFPLPSRVLDAVELRTGRKAAALDPAAKSLTLDDGSALPYDRLLLATGADSKPLGIPGEEGPGVFGFRTRDDAEAVDRAIRAGARRAVVLGGGFVGVKAAHALAARGVETLLCMGSPRPLSQVIDEETGALAAQALEEEGIRVLPGHEPEAVVRDGGRVTGVRFSAPAAVEPCDLVLRGKGVTPRAELAARGAESRRGIPVDETLRTPHPDVWAAGDAALAPDRVRGVPAVNAIWPVAVEEGRIAGLNMAGADERYEGGFARNSLRIGPWHFVSAGILRPRGEGYEVLSRSFPRAGAFRKVVVRDGVLVGFASAERDRRTPTSAGLLVAAVGAGAKLADLPFDPLDPDVHWGAYAYPMTPEAA